MKKKKTLKKIKAPKYQNINEKLQVVNETQFSITNRQVKLVPRFMDDMRKMEFKVKKVEQRLNLNNKT